MPKNKDRKLSERIHNFFASKKTMFNMSIYCAYNKNGKLEGQTIYACYNPIECYNTYLYICSVCTHNLSIKIEMWAELENLDKILFEKFDNLSDFRKYLVENNFLSKHPPEPREVDPNFYQTFNPKFGGIFIRKQLKGHTYDF